MGEASYTDSQPLGGACLKKSGIPCRVQHRVWLARQMTEMADVRIRASPSLAASFDPVLRSLSCWRNRCRTFCS